MKRPVFWLVLAVVAAASAFAAWRAFPDAFSIIALDISMDREHALAEARAVAARDHLGPEGFRDAASFTLDEEAQTFVELEGGGKDVFTAMLRDGTYAAYTWRVRHFKEGDANETTIAFTPDGRPNGFVERLREDAPGAAIDAPAAKQIAEREAAAHWAVDFSKYVLVEQGQERRPAGRIDHTLTYERPSPVLNEGRYRLRLVVSGDRLTAVSPFVKVPEAFSRRYESMRSANEAIGGGLVVALILLYGIGGIGIGLFVMLRHRWVLWGRALWWAIVIAGLQTLVAVNEWPLLWMSYSTAVPRTTFFLQQTAVLVGGFFGFTALYALSFIAAETLTRRAFGSHPQFWRAWGKGPGSSTAMLGRTAGGYLLVSVFFAYDVVLYLVATRKFGWWSPSEALFHPDVLATYVPWFSAIANSLQAGFWEECLFRAVPIAGAALIGDRFGKRRLFLVIGFVVQAVIFGSGHAPYPTQPAFARPVELIIPSIGFGLLYLRFGLVPGIILHFVFDTVWFALPIFVAHAPGIWLQRGMVIAVALIPLWIVIWRRVQAGRWTTLDPADRNAAWTPEAAEAREAETVVVTARRVSPRARMAWLVLAAASLVACNVMAVRGRTSASGEGLQVGRDDAIEIARKALEARQAVLPAGARFMATVESGGGPRQFVSETAGDERRKALVGSYLPRPRWAVRVATFEGDIAQRAEEWHVYVTDAREAWPIQHDLPEARAGASLDETAARKLALQAIAARFQFDPARGDIREISAKPRKLAARTDWTFTFVDETVPKLPQGEPRIAVGLSGDEITSLGRSIHVPETWQRDQQATDARNFIVQGLGTIVPVGLLLGAAVTGLLAWSRRRYAPKLFFAGVAQMLLATLAGLANQWPSVLASLSTAQPLPLQLGLLIGISIVGLGISAALISLAVGALPGRLAGLSQGLAEREALVLGMAAGCIAAAVGAAAAGLRTPAWVATSDLSPLDSASPILAMITDGVPGFFGKLAVITTLLAMVAESGRGWSLRRTIEVAVLFVMGFTSAGAPVGPSIGPWLAAACLTGAALVIVSIGLLTIDLTMVPVALGTATVLSLLMRAASGAFPGASLGSIGASVVVSMLAWWWFRALRRWRTRLPPAGEAAVAA